jgi:hypothetical protein
VYFAVDQGGRILHFARSASALSWGWLAAVRAAVLLGEEAMRWLVGVLSLEIWVSPSLGCGRQPEPSVETSEPARMVATPTVAGSVLEATPPGTATASPPTTSPVRSSPRAPTRPGSHGTSPAATNQSSAASKIAIVGAALVTRR